MTNKSAMEQLIEWLENMRVINFANEHYPYMPVLTEARRLAAEEAAEQSQTPTENKGGDKFMDWRYAGGPNECKHGYAEGIPCPHCSDPHPASPTKADKVESLAELADKNGHQMGMVHHYPSGNWEFDIFNIDMQESHFITGETYAEAEAKARQYLTGLDDVRGKGGRLPYA